MAEEIVNKDKILEFVFQITHDFFLYLQFLMAGIFEKNTLKNTKNTPSSRKYEKSGFDMF